MNIKYLVESLRHRPQSLAGVLRRELGKKRAAELQKGSALGVISEAARVLGVSESDFLKRVASCLGLSYVERIDSVDLSRLPWKFRLTELRRLGAIPVISNEVIKGFVAANPDILCDAANFASYPLGLASLELIKSALDESEERYRVRSASDPARDDVSLGVLMALIESCKEHGAEALQITIGQKPGYAFTTTKGKRAEGSISDVAVDGVKRLLGALTLRRISEFDARAEIGELSCQSDPNRGEFYLRWSALNKTYQVQEMKRVA